MPNRHAFFFPEDGPVYVPGTEITIFVPFDGDKNVFRIRGNTWGGHVPKADVDDGNVILRHTFADHDEAGLKSAIDRDIAAIQNKLRELENQFKSFNESLHPFALKIIEQRAERLRKDKDVLGKLGFNVRRRPDAPQTYATSTLQRKVSPRVQHETNANPTLDPALDFEEYRHILNVCRNMFSVIERSPAAFARMEEEHLRDHFLVQLNSQYQGQATGETFNYQGKSDILIRVQNKNIFIAECKFWKGEVAFKQTLDQLLGYACWRDSRLALIIFSRNDDFAAVLSKIPDAIKSHAQFVATEDEKPEAAEFTYRIRNALDANIIHHVAVLVFNVRVPVKALDK